MMTNHWICLDITHNVVLTLNKSNSWSSRSHWTWRFGGTWKCPIFRYTQMAGPLAILCSLSTCPFSSDGMWWRPNSTHYVYIPIYVYVHIYIYDHICVCVIVYICNHVYIIYIYICISFLTVYQSIRIYPILLHWWASSMLYPISGLESPYPKLGVPHHQYVWFLCIDHV